MGRLIDAGLVLDNLSGRLESMKDYDAVKDVINNMPTAYDLDNIVAQLEEIRVKKTCNKEKCDEKELCRICVVDDAIEIVKAGGVDG